MDDGDSTRLFVALFDYDPVSMSPNPDAAEEELPFQEGQILKVGTGLGHSRGPLRSCALLLPPLSHKPPHSFLSVANAEWPSQLKTKLCTMS